MSLHADVAVPARDRQRLERLVPLVPPPRMHQVRNHGVLAPSASGRDQVVSAGVHAKQAARSCSSASGSDVGSISADDAGGNGERVAPRGSPDVRAEGSESLARPISWADLLKRVFEIDALRCPGFAGRMRLIAAITEPDVARQILECLSLPPRAPPLAPANAIDLESAMDPIAFELTLVQVQEDRGFDFDQSAYEGSIPDDTS